MIAHRPVIGVNCNARIENTFMANVFPVNYLTRLWDSGAFPLVIPSMTEDDSHLDDYLDQVSGVLFIGGADYDPAFYDCPPDPHTEPIREHEILDFRLYHKALDRKLPILGVCAGCQLMSIVHGGKLIQHLDNATECHRNKYHQAKLVAPGWCADTLQLPVGSEFEVRSFHHQAVDPQQPGDGVRITARAFDDTVEVIEGTDSEFELGVQFHPERMAKGGIKFFQSLVEAAQKFEANRR